MFERFTERARQVVVLAQDEARSRGHDWIGVEHLLLGLLREPDGVAGRALADAGVTYAGARDLFGAPLSENERETTGQIPFTPRAMRALERSLRESLQLGQRFIGTEHLLLGVLRVSDAGPAAAALYELAASPTAVARHLLQRLSVEDAAYVDSFPDFDAGPPARSTDDDSFAERREPAAGLAEFAVPILPARDLHETHSFYERLGFGVVGAPPETYGYLIVRRGTIELHFFHAPDLDPTAAEAACYLHVRDADALHAEWSHSGLVLQLSEPHDTPYGMREFELVDPTGNELRVGS